MKKNYLLIVLATLILFGFMFFYETFASEVSTESYKVEQGDMLEIFVYEEEDLSGDFEVKEDGTISYPLIGSVIVEGLDRSAIETKLTGLLKKDYFHNPHLRLTIKEYHARLVHIIGSVKEPGPYEFPDDGNLTLLEAVSLAGGFDRYASVNGTKIIKTGTDGKRITIDPHISDILNGKKEDIDLDPGDIVSVPERFF